MNKLTNEEQIIKMAELRNKWIERDLGDWEEQPGLRAVMLGEYEAEDE